MCKSELPKVFGLPVVKAVLKAVLQHAAYPLTGAQAHRKCTSQPAATRDAGQGRVDQQAPSILVLVGDRCR